MPRPDPHSGNYVRLPARVSVPGLFLSRPISAVPGTPVAVLVRSCSRSFILRYGSPESGRLGSGLDDVGLVRQQVHHPLA
jgi:hypothetical protein